MNGSTNLSDAANKFGTRKAPVFGTAVQERRHRQERLAGVCRLFGRFGFSEGLLGHITVRDPEHTDLLWVNPVGVSFRQIKVSDLIQVSHNGEVLVGERPVNPVGLLLHSAIHEARPEIVAVCHAILFTEKRGRVWVACWTRSRKMLVYCLDTRH